AFTAWPVILLMHRAYLFLITGIVEVGTGIALLFLPSVPFAFLLGVGEAAPEALFVGRVAGAALLAIGVASWLAPSAGSSPAQLGGLIGVLIYDAVVAVLLGYAGTILGMVGFALWPAVVVHTGLAVWCIVCLWVKPRGE